MKRIIDFFRRDLVNTIVLVLTLMMFVVSLVKGEEGGFFYGILVLFIVRFMVWHYGLWDKVNAYVMDDEVRVNVFGLPRKSYSGKVKERKEWLEVVVLTVIVLGTIFLFGYLLLSLIGVV